MSRSPISISQPDTGEQEWLSVKECITSGWLTQGPKVKEFEQQFAQQHQVQSALATTSCTTALQLILAALDIGPGDEVIVPAFTWIATANVVVHCGATPVFADVNRDTNNIEPAEIARCITSKTRAVIVVHLFGLCADVDAVEAVLPQHITLIEDAACAAGASYKGRMAGSLGHAGAFSFHPRKIITTGEGGMLTTNDSNLASRADILRNHGASISEDQRHQGPKPHILPEFEHLGFNFRMTDLQGAIGLVQLAKLQRYIQQRQQYVSLYCRLLNELEWLKLPTIPAHGQHSWQAFVLYVKPEQAPVQRNEIMEILQSQGIATRPGTHAVHMQKYYAQRYSLQPQDFPAARDCHNNTLAIPLHNRMTEQDVEYIAQTIRLLESR